MTSLPESHWEAYSYEPDCRVMDVWIKMGKDEPLQKADICKFHPQGKNEDCLCECHKEETPSLEPLNS